ncbi:MAG: hypothetical protein IPO92_04490 [Saprospiraceae bacterium]|nr:hypothetical protein [Saprospiraceae bacterium]
MQKLILLVKLNLLSILLLAQNVGIGTSFPNTKLHIQDSSGFSPNLLKLQGSNAFISFYDNANTYKAHVWDAGNQLQVVNALNFISLAPGFNPLLIAKSNGKVGFSDFTAA